MTCPRTDGILRRTGARFSGPARRSRELVHEAAVRPRRPCNRVLVAGEGLGAIDAERVSTVRVGSMRVGVRPFTDGVPSRPEGGLAGRIHAER